MLGPPPAQTPTLQLASGRGPVPHHPPEVIAEQVGTLNTLAAGRIALGRGRAPGSDHRPMLALRRDGSG
ncbi:LLM class flavin-dependent oxidoreductase, partial [Escherichia coli]